MTISIFICGVGGQGIGLMGEVLCHALSDAGKRVMATETHGVAQRGGTVTTHIRFGDSVRTPKIGNGEADFVFSLERLEGLRFVNTMLRTGGTLVYYDTVQQPQTTRASGTRYPDNTDVVKACLEKDVQIAHISLDNLASPQMQNVALLGRIASLQIIPGVTPELVRKVLVKLLPQRVQAMNLQVFDRGCRYSSHQPVAAVQSSEFQGLRAFPVIARI